MNDMNCAEILSHALDIAEKTGFTPDEISFIAPTAGKILETNPEGFAELEKAVLAGEDDLEMLYALTRPLRIEDDYGMLVLCLLLTHASHKLYRERGIDEEIYLASMKDIRVWAVTCLENYQRLGLYEYGWVRNFLTASIVRLGRLEFHIITYDPDEPYTACGVTVKNGDPVINTHIPADGPLKPEEVQDAFRRAYRYFGKSGITPIVCHSWLLYPKNRLFCAPESNIVAFLDCFDIIESSEPNRGDLWRVFGRRESYDPDTLPESTTMQKNLKAYLKAGGSLGNGYGILLHDGEKIVRD